MNIGTCKRSFAALALLALAACDGAEGLNLKPADSKATAQAQASLAGGRVAVVPPKGFCIDGASLKQRFALIASCRALGAKDAPYASHQAFLTISVVRSTALPEPAQLRDSAGLTDTIRVRHDTDGIISFRAKSEAAFEGFDKTHWRGTAQIGDYVAGVALYAPTGSPAHSEEGRALLRRLITRSRDATDQKTAADAANETDPQNTKSTAPAEPAQATPLKKRLSTIFGGLFE